MDARAECARHAPWHTAIIAVAVAAALLASALVGCSSDPDPQAETTDSPPAASTATAAADTGASESDDPTAAELAWAKEQLRWIEQMEELLGTVDAVKRIGRAHMDTIEREAARQAIFNLIRCANRSGREYEAPPSLPTALISDTLGKACGRLNRAGLAASSHLLVTDPHNDTKQAGKHWEEESKRARELLTAGRGQIEDLQQEAG